MTTRISELPRTDLPRVLIYVTAMICGVFAAITAQVLLRRNGIELGDAWRSLASGQTLQTRSVSAYWLMLGASFLISAIVAAALSRLPLPWHRLRPLRWLLSVVLVFALAEVGHIAGVTGGHGGGVHSAMTLAVLAAATLVALFGAYFATRH